MGIEVWEGDGECPKCDWPTGGDDLLNQGFRSRIYAALEAAQYLVQTEKGPALRKAQERSRRMTAIKEGLHRHYTAHMRDECRLTADEIVLLAQSLEWWGRREMSLLDDSDDTEADIRQKTCDDISFFMRHYQGWMMGVGACAVKPASHIKTVAEINKEHPDEEQG